MRRRGRPRGYKSEKQIELEQRWRVYRLPPNTEAIIKIGAAPNNFLSIELKDVISLTSGNHARKQLKATEAYIKSLGAERIRREA